MSALTSTIPGYPAAQPPAGPPPVGGVSKPTARPKAKAALARAAAAALEGAGGAKGPGAASQAGAAGGVVKKARAVDVWAALEKFNEWVAGA